MDKKRLLEEIIAKLRLDAEKMLAAAISTRDEATHEDNKAESKYDTRGLEASYLAEAQARQAEEAEANLQRFVKMQPRDYEAGDPISLTALVEVKMGNFADWYFIGPGAGGMELEIDDQECTVVTLDSPMGGRLDGARVGETFDMNGRKARILTVL